MPRQHFDKLANLFRSGLRLLHRLYPKKDRIAIGAIEALKERLGPGIRIQRHREIRGHNSAARRIVRLLPSPAFLGALNRLEARRLHLPVLDQRQRLFPVDFRPNAVFSPRNKPLQPSPIGFASLLPVNPPVAQSNFESIAIGKRLQR